MAAKWYFAEPGHEAASAGLARRAFQLAVSSDRPVYDCLYLALALEIEAPLVTADAQLARVARAVPVSVELIA